MLTVDMISLMSRYESSRSLWLGIPGNVGWMLVSGMLVGWITNSQQTLCKLEVQLSSFVSCFHARVVCFCPSLGYAGSTDLSSSSFTAVIHGYSMNSLPSQWNSRYGGGHRCPFLTPNRNLRSTCASEVHPTTGTQNFKALWWSMCDAVYVSWISRNGRKLCKSPWWFWTGEIWWIFRWRLSVSEVSHFP